MYCSECGRQVDPAAKFCHSCGTALEPTVPTRPVGNTPVPHRAPVAAPRPAPARTGRASRFGKKPVLLVAFSLLLIAAVFFSQHNGDDGADKPFQQWMSTANPFYQQYFTVMNNFENVNQNRDATRRDVTGAWEQLVQDLRALQGKVGGLQPTPSVSQADAADMQQLQVIWKDLLAVELQISEQMLRYSRAGQRPPDAFLQRQLPAMWQARNKLMENQQQVLSRLFARHQVQAVSATPSGRN